uniref:DNA-directed RNA polymerase n=1 Tax=Dicranema revolutum TaxID=239144 RepID=A0A4D6WSH7_9FLOR|nr:RNA polymerase b'-subunit [Dicranema revolutum]
MKKFISQPKFVNKVIDKNQLKQIIVWIFRNYGIARATDIADSLKDLGFYYATKAGISLSLEDLRIPPTKNNLLHETINSIKNTDNRYKLGKITVVERFQKVIETWNKASETLKKEVIKYFKQTDPLNSIYMMAFSGARGNISQVRQLVGMRGLMSDPQGQIIDLPISSNFREGLTVTDYFISCYGARKGLVDTALRTADSGYLTRRLVDVAQDVIIREIDCKTSKGILLEETMDNHKVLISLEQALLGRVLAEDIIDTRSDNIIGHTGQDICPDLAAKIIEIGYKAVLVRSPITCESIKSVCQLCYGWNLAHGKTVDLGEAVGIIAAQSIGEPGTQLTMRTFHTGGVFTGELAQTIVNTEKSQVKYPDNILFTNSRNRYGDTAILINSDCKLKLTNCTGIDKFINLVKGTLLLVKNNKWINPGEIIAEYPLNNRVITEVAQKTVISDYSGSVHCKNFTSKKNSEQRSNISNTVESSILWVLSGVVYNIPNNAQIMVNSNQNIYENSLIASVQFVSNYSGHIKISKNLDKYQQISIITSSKIFANSNIYKDNSNDIDTYILEIDKTDKFLINAEPQKKIIHDQIIGELITDIYKTKTGGIIKYLDLPISQKKSNSHYDYYDILGTGYILWIPEETHEINKDISLLLVKHGTFVEVGTEIIKNIFANNTGLLEIIQRDGIIREIIIKPGKMYKIHNKDSNVPLFLGKYRGFLKPGEPFVSGIVTDRLVYWEYINTLDEKFILIRPVIVYSVPTKKLNCSYTSSSFGTEMFNLKITRRTYFRDGARVKSIDGINLLKTYLVAKLSKSISSMFCTIDLVSNNSKSKSLLKLSTEDLISLKESLNVNDKNFYTKTLIRVQNEQYITSNSIVAETKILSKITGKIENIQENNTANRRLLITTPLDIRTFNIDNNQLLKVKINDWVYKGDNLTNNIVIYCSGKIVEIKNNQVKIRIGQPYLIPTGSIIHINNNNLIQKGENIATLIFKKAKTGDIVQGLPRVEEILEARKKSDNSFNPHKILESKFHTYLKKGLNMYDSTKLSLLDIQLSLIKEVQLVYQSQGVEISDKHIEVIIRQMTSKVEIKKGGNTDYLPGEIIDLQKIELINKSLITANKRPASYRPILLGITKASLNTESFISAASFQETTKVLTEAAIAGKLDWLRGLKENVIIGRLIPAGTGFNIYANSLLDQENNLLISNNNIFNEKKLKNDQQECDFEDIILDDRNAKDYPLVVDIHSNTIK